MGVSDSENADKKDDDGQSGVSAITLIGIIISIVVSIFTTILAIYLGHELSTLKDENSELQNEIIELRKTRESDKQEIIDLNGRITILQHDNSNLSDQVIMERAKHDRITRKMDKIIANLNEVAQTLLVANGLTDEQRTTIGSPLINLFDKSKTFRDTVRSCHALNDTSVNFSDSLALNRLIYQRRESENRRILSHYLPNISASCDTLKLILSESNIRSTSPEKIHKIRRLMDEIPNLLRDIEDIVNDSRVVENEDIENKKTEIVNRYIPEKTTDPDYKIRTTDENKPTPRSKILQLEGNKITSYFFRRSNKESAQLTMLIMTRDDFTRAIRSRLDKKVTPIVFSVLKPSTSAITFDPSLLCFEQHGRSWQPSKSKDVTDIFFFPLKDDNNEILGEAQTSVAIVLLPHWFDDQSQVAVHYRDTYSH